MKKDEYKCDSCKNIYTYGWTDEDKKKEAEKNFGKPVDEWKDDPAIVCDDCCKKMLPDEHLKEVEGAKQII